MKPTTPPWQFSLSALIAVMTGVAVVLGLAVAVGVVAINDGVSPKDVVIRARRIVGTDCRPNQAELKEMFG